MDTITPDSVFAPSDDVVSREIEGELIIVPITSGIGDLEDELYTLNDTGRAIWHRLDGRRTLADIAAELEKEFDAPLETIIQDVLGLTGELASRKIVVCRS